MTRKKKVQGKKTNVSKDLPSPSVQNLSPLSENSQGQTEEEQLEDSNASDIRNSTGLAEESGGEQVEGLTNVDNVSQLQCPPFVISGEATTSSGSINHGENQEQQELEAGLSQVASHSKNNPVLSPLAAVFESNLNIVRNKNTEAPRVNVDITQNDPTCGDTRENGPNIQTRANTTYNGMVGENSAQLTDNATSVFDSQWAEKFRKLEQLENARREALDKQMLDARLKLEKEMNQARAEHEILKKRREIERQQAELRLLEEEYGNKLRPLVSASENLSNADNPNNYYNQQPQTTTTCGTTLPNISKDNSFQLQHLLERQQNTMDEVVRGLRMPQREYMSFSGEPRNFPLFMKNFEVNVESKEKNDADRLNYLIQYCRGKARQAIEHCIIMPPEEGYKRAKEILKKNFGRNHVVTQAFLDKVLNGPSIKANEPESLSQLARDMETCLLGSTQLGNEANINSIDTLGKVVGRLPIHLRSKWAEKASQLYDNHIIPNFTHLTEFVQSRAAVANTYFGQIITSRTDTRKDGADKSKKKPFLFSGTNLATYGQGIEGADDESKERKFSCVLCKGTHHLERCHKFRAQSLQQRRDLVKSKRVCHACLSPGHFVKSCRGARICGVEGCQRRHHPLLHSSELKPKEEVKPDNVSSVRGYIWFEC